jgi:hypothetical protein
MPPKKPKQEEKQLPATIPERRSLQSYQDYVDLAEEMINGIFDKTYDTKQTNAACAVASFGLQAIKEGNSGKLKMNVFLQNMETVNVGALSTEEMDRFLQGSEDVQVEVLQILEARGGMKSADVKVTPKKEIKPKIDVKVLSKLTGLEGDSLKQAFAGAGEKPTLSHKVHDWIKAVNSEVRFCKDCGKETERLQPEDATSPCSGEWGMT